MKKKLLLLAVVFSIIICFGVSEVMAGCYKAGTYTASAIGRTGKGPHHSGIIEVAVKVSDSKIEDIKVVKYEQSVDHKKYGPLAIEAKDTIVPAIIKNQSIDVDVVTKATMSSNGLELAVAKALHQATAKYKDGTYKGVAQGRKGKGAGHSGVIEVDVTIAAGKIKDIKVVKYEQSVDHKKYGPLALQAKADIPAAIIKNQSLDVDVVSKATFSSVALELAVAKALEQAR